MFKATCIGLALGLILILAGAVQASLYLEESFDAYLSGELLSDQNGGTGFDAANWSASTSAGLFSATIGSGIPFSTLSSSTSGKSVKLETSGMGTSDWALAKRKLNVTGTQEMWMSLLYQWDNGTTYDDEHTQLVLDFLSDSAPLGYEPRFGLNLNSEGGLRLYGATTTLSTTGLHNGTPHLIVAKYYGTGGVITNAKVWILSETVFDNVKVATGGFTEANLDSLVAASARGTGAPSEGQSLLGTTDKVELLRIRGTTSQWLDEFRVADSLTNLALPEPATLSLLGLGAVAMFLRRRRQIK
jgi:hypothetical protein